MPSPLDSRIASVTVFKDRAKIARVASITLPAGESAIVFANLPTSLSPESVRVKGRGTGVRIVSTDVPLVRLVDSPDVTVADLLKQIEDREAALRELADRQAIPEQRLKTAAAVRANASGDVVKGVAWGKSGLESLEALLGFADREEMSARAEIRGLAVQQKTLSKELEALRERLRQLQQPASVRRRNIVVTVEAAAADTPFEIEASYTCEGASWTPLYDARLDGSAVRITYLASVTQSTGEDWSGVDLSLSTARPAVTTEIPELQPWYLSVYVPPPPAPPHPQMMMRMAAAAPMAMMDEAVAGSAPMPLAEIHQASVEDHGASATFRIPRRANIPSDGTPHRAQIAEFELPAKLDYITAPKIAEQAYLRATVKNDSPFVLLPGAGNLFHGDEFVGVTRIEDTAAREFELQMGVDERVTVERELTNRDVSKTFMGGTRRSSYGYRIKIVHRLTAAAPITVIDQLPHSTHEEIKVKLNDAVPKPAEQTDLSELRWRGSLEPGRDFEVSFSFTVEAPKHLTVEGL